MSLNALNVILTPFYSILGPLVATAVAGAVIKVALQLHAFLATKTHFASLSGATDATAIIVENMVKAAGGTLPPSQATLAAIFAAGKAGLQAQIPNIEVSMNQEIDALVASLVAAHTGVPAATVIAAANAK